MSEKNKTNNQNIGGHFLCSGSLKEFKAAGELGQSVYQIANALRTAIQRHKKSDLPLERFFAIPYENSQSNTVDWYADEHIPTDDNQPTTIINWNQADAQEQEQAKAKILAFKEEINELSKTFTKAANKTTSDLYVFSQLLPKTLLTPTHYSELKDDKTLINPSYIFLVGKDQQPVLAFWGFTHPNAPITEEPFHLLFNPQPEPQPVQPIEAPAAAAFAAAPPPEPPPSTPPITPTPVVETRRNWWSWLRWLLLALLLLLLLLFAWRSCSKPSMPTMPSPPNASLSSHANTDPIDDSAGRLWGMKLPSLPSFSWPNWASKFGLGSSATPNANTPSPTAESALSPKTTPNPSVSHLDQPATAADLSQTEVGTPTSSSTLGEQLHIPPELINQSTPSYMDGQWNVHGIQDEKTGQSVRLQYAIDNGEGMVQIHKSDGTRCNGHIQAAGTGGELHINSTSNATCDDNSQYDMPEVRCGLNAHQQTECFGYYGDQRFPISMRNAAQ